LKNSSRNYRVESKQNQAETRNHPQWRKSDTSIPAYASRDEPIDLPTNIVVHEHSAEHYEELNSTSVNNLKDKTDAEHVYTHINSGPTSTKVIDATHSHAPGNDMSMIGYTCTQHSELNQNDFESNTNAEKDRI